ncbi:MAG: amidohydrolase family protein, partial [Rhodothermales bacterium]
FPDGYRLMTGEVVTPGLIDAHSVAGLAGILNIPHDQDQLEKSDPIQPDLRAIDAYNPREELITWLRELGVTTVHTGHGPGALISGQTMTVKTRGETISEALIDSTTMVAFSLGPIVEVNFKKPGTRAKSVAMLREALLEAEAYRSKRQDDDAANDGKRELGNEVLSQVLNGDLPALVTAQRATEIMSALRLAEEFGLKIVLDGAAESYLLIDEIKEAGVPVILHPTMARPSGEMENITFETAKLLHDAGISVALQSGYEGYVPKTRVVLFEAALAAANGMSFEDALATITVEPARILGIEDRVGTLTVGKDADIVLFDGDPFEYTTHGCGVIIEGEIMSETCR